jgi:hypothetical protein
MPLLTWRPQILLQNPVDERRDQIQFRLGPRRIAPRLRQRSGQRLPHHPAMHSEFGCHACHRPNAEFMLPAKLLE